MILTYFLLMFTKWFLSGGLCDTHDGFCLDCSLIGQTCDRFGRTPLPPGCMRCNVFIRASTYTGSNLILPLSWLGHSLGRSNVTAMIRGTGCKGAMTSSAWKWISFLFLVLSPIVATKKVSHGPCSFMGFIHPGRKLHVLSYGGGAEYPLREGSKN